MATHPSMLAWKIPRTEEPGGLPSMESQESDKTKPPPLLLQKEIKNGEDLASRVTDGAWLIAQGPHIWTETAQALPHLRPSREPWCGCTRMHTWVEQIEGPGSDVPSGRGTLKPAPLLEGHMPRQWRRSTALLFTGHGEKAENLLGPSGWKRFYATLPRLHCRKTYRNQVWNWEGALPTEILKEFLTCCLVTKLCLVFCDSMDCSPPGSSVHGMSQARILEWAALSYSRGSFRSRDQTWNSCTGGRFFTTEPPVKPS